MSGGFLSHDLRDAHIFECIAISLQWVLEVWLYLISCLGLVVGVLLELSSLASITSVTASKLYFGITCHMHAGTSQ